MSTLEEIYLDPIDNRKSFYKKALIIKTEVNGEIISYLKSYDTIVSEYNNTTKKLKINGWYTSTTARHINSFLAYYGLATMTKKQMIEFINSEGEK